MREPLRPKPLPSLLPFVVIALLLVVIYGGLLLFPTIKGLIDQRECVAAGQTECRPPR